MATFLFSKKSDSVRKLGDYQVGETVGEGTTCKVKVGRDPVSGKLVALKIMDTKVFLSSQVQQELEILRHFGEIRNRHPNIIGLHSVLHDVKFESKHGLHSKYQSRQVSVIVTEYMDGGDLFTHVAGKPFDEDTAKAVFQQLVRGTSHLHKHGVVHLDIKPENILIAKNGIVKITDFGFSVIVKPLRSKRRGSKLSVTANINRPSPMLSRQTRAGTMPIGLRAVASLNSLQSAISGSSAESSSSLSHFFPEGHQPSPLGCQLISMARQTISPNSYARSSSDGREEEEEDEEERNAHTHHHHQHQQKVSTNETDKEDLASEPLQNEPKLEQVAIDSELFHAISTGKTREQLALDEQLNEDSARRLTIMNGIGGFGMRHSSSMNALSAFTSKGMGNKVSSSTSISSLDSYSSRCSKESTRSTTSRYRAPKLVVNSRSGTLCYQAPEVSVGNYDGAKADVYSLGIVLHVMFYGVLPFDGDDDECPSEDFDDDNASITSKRWSPPSLIKLDHPISELALDLLQNMLNLDPKTRFSLKDVMRHQWVDASKVRGSVQTVASLIKRRDPHVQAQRKLQMYKRKAINRKKHREINSVMDDDPLPF